MAKLNYERDVQPLVKKMNKQFKAARGCDLGIRQDDTKFEVTQTGSKGTDVLINGTLRECYSFLLGMNEFLE